MSSRSNGYLIIFYETLDTFQQFCGVVTKNEDWDENKLSRIISCFFFFTSSNCATFKCLIER